MTKVSTKPRASRERDVPEAFVEKGAELVAEGLRIAGAVHGWIRDVATLDAATSLFADTDEIVDVQEADELLEAWGDASRLPDLLRIARWVAGQTYCLTGEGDDPEMTFGRLAEAVKVSPGE